MKTQNSLDEFVEAYNENFEFSFDNNIILRWYPQRIIQSSSPGASVLELGIGHGYTCDMFSRYYKNYTVIDASEKVIRQFKEQYPDARASIVEGYFEEYNSSEKFDIIIMGFVLEHVEDPKQVLSHYKSFLAPGGRLYVGVPNAHSLHRRIGNKAGLLDDMMTLGQGDKALGHLRLYTVDTLTQDIEDCGYKVTKKEGIFLKPFMTSQLTSLELSQDIIDGMCKVGVDYPELSASLLFEATA